MLVGWNLPPGSCSLSHAAQTHTPSEGTELRQYPLQTPHFLRQGLPSQNSAVPMEPPELSYIVSGSINWQSLWKTENLLLQCLLELSSKDEATRVYSHDLAIPHLTGMCTYSIRNVLEIHSSIMCSTPKLETTQMHIHRRMDKAIVVYSYHTLLHSNEKTTTT